MKRKLFIIPIAFLLAISLTVTAFAASITLGVSEIDQNKTYWCWAACSEMIGKYYNSNSDKDQYDIVEEVKGNTNNQGGSSDDICEAIQYASGNTVTFQTRESALSFSSCQTEIDNSDPFVVWLAGTSMSHVIVASGYKTGSTNYLYIIDPSPNVSAQYFSYTALVNGTTGTLGTRCYERTMYRD